MSAMDNPDVREAQWHLYKSGASQFYRVWWDSETQQYRVGRQPS